MNSSNVITQVTDTSTAPSDPSYVNNFVLLPPAMSSERISAATSRYTRPRIKHSNQPVRPVVNSAPSCISAGGTYFVSGTQFNGLSHGAAYGDDYQSDTNFPLVRIVNNQHRARCLSREPSTTAHVRLPSARRQARNSGTTSHRRRRQHALRCCERHPSMGTAVTSGLIAPVARRGHDNGHPRLQWRSSSIPESDIAWHDASAPRRYGSCSTRTISDSGGFGRSARTPGQSSDSADYNGDGAHDWLCAIAAQPGHLVHVRQARATTAEVSATSTPSGRCKAPET